MRGYKIVKVPRQPNEKLVEYKNEVVFPNLSDHLPFPLPKVQVAFPPTKLA